MSNRHILRNYHNIVIYSQNQWELLNSKRNRAIELLSFFTKEGLNPYVYGSVARGDVTKDSDIDIIFLNRVPSFKVEYILTKNGFENFFREIIMATPSDSLKLYIYLSELECITIPLTKLEKNSLEFYSFGGRVNFEQLESNIRVPGIDKRLVLISPTQKGHEEMSIINYESNAAKKVGVSTETTLERKRVLLRREKHGRTGPFIKKPLRIEESTQEALKELANKKAIVRRKLFER